MNELDALKDLLTGPGPSHEVRDAGRRRLAEAVRGEGRRSGGLRSWRGAALSAAALAAVVTTVAVVVPGPRGAAPPASPASATTQAAADAGTLLREAAAKIEKLPTAAYWRVDTRRTQQRPDTPGLVYKHNTYQEWSLWVSTSPDKGSVFLLRYVNDDVPGAQEVTLLESASEVGGLGDAGITLEQLATLPTDPDELKQALARRVSDHNDPKDSDPSEPPTTGPEDAGPDPSLEGGGAAFNARLYSATVHLIVNLPVRSEVRAAAYRVLASLPGVRDAGPVVDSMGRPGHAVELAPDPDGVPYRLVLDPETGLPRAREMADTLDQRLRAYEVFTRIGWTDEAPERS
ncbi:CU044_5270 family protein [Actinocorallia sp. API 0066]|uniref:CU044_5270 family protein n=1 Tax=Actinocorallia sp. API 0066 TaxID=2896846 RepID=UPI001E5345AD|nr:CU044_5270 family protein [Actinocorallia sp. API 0066]MCD0450686.1 CU044_5270 family protein [Actinocorallia sp. API 0066]